MRDLKPILERDNAVYYSYEPLQRILPKLSDEDKEDLKIDIGRKGLKETIKVVKLKPTRDMDKNKNHYVVLDGVHRLEAIKELGIEPKIQIGEVKKEDWLRIGIQLNVGAKRGRQIRRKDLVKKLYRRYKRRVERVGKRPSIDEFRQELRTYEIHLSLETVKKYLFEQRKRTNTNESLESQGTPGGLCSPKLTALAKQLGKPVTETLSMCLEIAKTVIDTANQLGTSPDELLRALQGLKEVR